MHRTAAGQPFGHQQRRFLNIAPSDFDRDTYCSWNSWSEIRRQKERSGRTANGLRHRVWGRLGVGQGYGHRHQTRGRPVYGVRVRKKGEQRETNPRRRIARADDEWGTESGRFLDYGTKAYPGISTSRKPLEVVGQPGAGQFGQYRRNFFVDRTYFELDARSAAHSDDRAVRMELARPTRISPHRRDVRQTKRITSSPLRALANTVTSSCARSTRKPKSNSSSEAHLPLSLCALRMGRAGTERGDCGVRATPATWESAGCLHQ